MPVATLAERRREKLTASGVDGEPPVFGSISFGGVVSVRTQGRAPASAYVARPGDLVFSKIDARNGAFGIVPLDGPALCFSAEFPIYDFAGGPLLAPFVQLLCRTGVFRSLMAAAASGHSGRKRVSPEAFEALLLPAPDEKTQRSVLEWTRARELEVDQLQAEIRQLRSLASRRLLEQLEVSVPPIAPTTRPFAVGRRKLLNWSVKHAAYAALSLSEELSSAYPVVTLADRDLAEVRYGLTKNQANRPGKYPTPYLRVANVQADHLDLSEVKLIDLPPDRLDRYRLKHGDLLLCEGNSLELVGRPALWREEVADCVHQNHVLRVRLDASQLAPEYVVAYMNSLPARRYFLRRAKRTTNLATINSTDVKELPIPLPPMDVQLELVHNLAELRGEVGSKTADLQALQSRTQLDLNRALETGQLEMLV